MLDFSKYSDDKDSYIKMIAIDEFFEYFKVFYASGRVEEHDFTIHNYHVYINRMEKQFNLYKYDFQADINKCFSDEARKNLIANVMIVVGILMSCSMDINLIIKIILFFLGGYIILYNLKKIIKIKEKLMELVNKAALIEILLEHKEEIALDVLDPISGNKEKWYMVDINNIGQFQSVIEFFIYTQSYRSELIKEELSKDLTQAFEDAYVLKKRKQGNVEK